LRAAVDPRVEAQLRPGAKEVERVEKRVEGAEARPVQSGDGGPAAGFRPLG
jgi:hypothetical protein